MESRSRTYRGLNEMESLLLGARRRMSDCEEVADPDYFELLISRFTPQATSEESRINTVQELDERLAPVRPEPRLAILLCCVAEEADWGSFTLLLNGERALVHLLEGPCFTARDPNLHAPGAVPGRRRLLA